jgi:hypothetical protein
MRRAARVPVVVGLGILGTGIGIASASEIGVSPAPIEVGSAQVVGPTCPADQVVIDEVRATYSAGDYLLSSINFSTLGTECRNDPYLLTFANNVPGRDAIVSTNGTSPSATGFANPAEGGNINLLNSTNNQVVTYLVVRG